MQENVDHDDDQQQRFKKRLNDFLNAGGNREGGVQTHFVIQIGRKSLLERLHRGAYALRRLHRVGAGQLIQCQDGRRLAVIAADYVVGLRAEFDPGQVLQPQIRPVRICADDDFAEFLSGNQTPLGAHGVRELLSLRNRFAADFPRRVHRVLNLDGLNNLGNRNLKFGQLVRLHPDAHRVLPGAKYQNFRDTRHARQVVH